MNTDRLPQNKRNFRQVETKKQFVLKGSKSQERHPSSTKEHIHTLSMGHRIHKISFDSESDAIKITLYHAINAKNEVETYNYSVWVPIIKVSQVNKIDSLLN